MRLIAAFRFLTPSILSDTIVGYRVVEEMGIVVGTSARSRSFVHDLMQRIRGVVGGSLTDYEVRTQPLLLYPQD